MTTLRTLEDIITELKLDIMRRNPAISDWSPLSVNLTLAQAYSKQIYDLEQLIQETADSLFINTATGAALDKLVVDRLPEGRQGGTKAYGSLTFGRSTAAPVDIVIPLGSIVSQPNPNGDPIYFETTAAGTLAKGDLTVAIDATAMLEGVDGNAPSGTITGLIAVASGVQSVTNSLAFTDGTDQESDEDLRKRYIYAVQIPGRATENMIVQHLYDLDTVTEAKVFTILPGVVEIVVATSTVVNPDPEIEETIIDNIAAGIVARGTVGATIVGGKSTVNVDTCAGGYVYVVVDSVPTGAEDIEFEYKNVSNATRTGSVTIPASSAIGVAVQAVLQSTDDRAISIAKITTYAGSGDYTLVMGQGAYPYLYNLPLLLTADIDVTVTLTTTPETDLLDNIIASLEDCLNAYYIGDDIQFSDLLKYVYRDYATDRPFVGIDSVDSMSITCDGSTITALGESITIANDSRVEAGTVTVTET